MEKKKIQHTNQRHQVLNLLWRFLEALEPLGITAVEEELFFLQSDDVLTLVARGREDGDVVTCRDLKRADVSEEKMQRKEPLFVE